MQRRLAQPRLQQQRQHEHEAAEEEDQGARGYAQLRKQDVDRRFPGLLDSILNADAAVQVLPG